MPEGRPSGTGNLCNGGLSQRGRNSGHFAGHAGWRGWRVTSATTGNTYLTKVCTDIIELGIPFTDPIADGPTIQKSNLKALENGVTISSMLDIVRDARRNGLKTPVLFMGYYNPILRYGESKLFADCKAVGVSGFIVVDLPLREAIRFRQGCTKTGYVTENAREVR